MTGFEFVFALYSLLLGLSMVELLSGFGRVLEVRLAVTDNRAPAVVGWLTPLLAVFVMLDLLSFWAAAWVLRAAIAVTAPTLMAITLFASLYFLAARLVFPAHPETLATLDTHYFRVRRVVLVLLLILLGAQIVFYVAHPALVPAITRPFTWVMTAILAALMVAAMVVKGPRASALVLSALVARYLVVYLI